jgi:hypothetical protein
MINDFINFIYNYDIEKIFNFLTTSIILCAIIIELLNSKK